MEAFSSKSPGFIVGETVNYGFNGDYYTAIVLTVSASGHQVLVRDAGASGESKDDYKLFTRRADGSYRSKGHGTWRLAKGARDERNPSF